MTSIGPLLWHWVDHSDQLGFGASPLNKIDTTKSFEKKGGGGGPKNHFDDDDDVEDEDEDISIEVSLEDLVNLRRRVRLSIRRQNRHPLACPYATDRKSIYRTVYDCAFLSFTLEEK